MKILKRITWMSTGSAFALLAGAPALADDTELLLVNPDPTNNPKPNVLFILDNSGSMDSIETVNTPYDYSQDYGTSPCDPDKIYWTELDTAPDCSTTDQWVWKTAFQCDYASNQMQGIGSFTNTMVQYRGGGKDGTGSGPVRWQYLAAGYHDEPIECQADSGEHGDGRSTHLWATNGTNEPDPWTDNAQGELSWGSAPRNIAYTFYDGNYMNWQANPVTTSMQRFDIMKSVTTAVLRSVKNMNVGMMAFNWDDGGTLLTGLTDLDTMRADVIADVNNLPFNRWTPLAEVLYENALYWTGGNLKYGEYLATDLDAVVGGTLTNGGSGSYTGSGIFGGGDRANGVGQYLQPTFGSCAKNYNVYISDGEPTEDDEVPGLVSNLPDWSSTLGHSGCDYGGNSDGDGACLPDVAEYLFTRDLDPDTEVLENVVTHTIGFTSDIPVLTATASAGGGRYFRADNVEDLTLALLRIVGEIEERSVSFSAPAVAVNSFNRTRNLNDVFMTVFAARRAVRWPGNLKKYSIDVDTIVDANGDPAVDASTGFFDDAAQSFWSATVDGKNVRAGGAANELADPVSGRNVYTNNGSSNNLYDTSNRVLTTNGAFTLADFGLTGAAGEPTLAELIRWVRGEDVQDVDGDGDSTEQRFEMGDPLHARPAAVIYGGTAANPDTVLFVATNEGYVHAINGSTGAELWSFIPNELLPRMARLYFDPNTRYKEYGMDGDITSVTRDVDGDGVIEPADGDYVRLVMGMRRGGSTYYALDVSSKTQPKLMWTKTVNDAGESWSAPVITRLNIDDSLLPSPGLNADKAVVVVGGGYDVVHDTAEHPSTDDAVGANIHIIDLVSGNTLWWGGGDQSGATQEFDDMTRAFATQIRVVDLNGDRFADRMYASDMGGQVWRFDLYNGEDPADLVEGGVIARLGAEGINNPTLEETRRFYNSPDVSIFRDPVQGRRYVSVAIGSGYRAHPYDVGATDRFYALRDPDVFTKLNATAYDNYDVIEDGDLVEVSGSVKTAIGASDRGWKFTLPANEKVITESLTFDDEIFFVSFDPTGVGADECGVGRGTNFLYRVTVSNGDPVVNNLDAVTPALADPARKQQLEQGGIAPSPTVLFPSPPSNCSGPSCNPPPLLCIGVECSQPGFRNVPVRTLWTQTGIE